jgi:putative transposase
LLFFIIHKGRTKCHSTSCSRNFITYTTIKIVSMKKLYSVSLKEEDREELSEHLRRGKASARSPTRARILLLADEGWPDKEIFETLRVSKLTVNRISKRYCDGDLDFSLHEKARSGAPPKLDGKMEAQLTPLVCSEPLDGRSKWTLRLLADKLVEMEVVDSVSHMSVQRLLKKMKLNLG